MEIDINRKDFYEYGKPELEDRTRNRIQEMIDTGMTEVGVAQFGVKGVMSGLYLEFVWSKTEEDWKDYMDWVRELIAEKRGTTESTAIEITAKEYLDLENPEFVGQTRLNSDNQYRMYWKCNEKFYFTKNQI